MTLRIEEHVVPGRRLGRHILHDERSKAFKPATGPLKSVIHQAVGLPLDQGNLGSCTANALCGALNCTPNSPHLKHGPFKEHGAVTLYELETKLEGEPYPPNDPGGTGVMVCTAAKQLGWISSYQHALSLDQALGALALRPIIIGINWYTSFDTPNSSGLVEIASGATIRGGHEVCVNELNVEQKLVGIWNSWGKTWGLGGRFYMSFDTLGSLLSDQGDATVPVG